jgi:site-specific DNA-methyltransferase (adenine-specific)
VSYANTPLVSPGGTSQTVEWETPQALFDSLDGEFHFTLDPCATEQNAKCRKFFTRAVNGLAQSWAGERIFMNPPYGREIAAWTEKALHAVQDERAVIVVGLLPVRSDTAWWHDHVLAGGAEVRFLRGRLTFNSAGRRTRDRDGSCRANAPFPSAIVVWRRQKQPML